MSDDRRGVTTLAVDVSGLTPMMVADWLLDWSAREQARTAAERGGLMASRLLLPSEPVPADAGALLATIVARPDGCTLRLVPARHAGAPLPRDAVRVLLYFGRSVQPAIGALLRELVTLWARPPRKS